MTRFRVEAPWNLCIYHFNRKTASNEAKGNYEKRLLAQCVDAVDSVGKVREVD
jgi:hypothetical protein